MDINDFVHWRSSGLQERDGIMVASSRELEHLLPWWWLNYRLHNAYPVVFVSFDMSQEALTWCRKRGEVIELKIPDDFIAKRTEIDPDKLKIWDRVHGLTETNIEKRWFYRSRWMCKPFALLYTPFKRTIWFDIDCQVRKPVDALFNACDNPAGVALAIEPSKQHDNPDSKILFLPGEKIYNSGVIAYKRKAVLIDKWIKTTIQRNAEFYGDQETLSRIIYEEKLQLGHVPESYNWLLFQGMNEKAAVLHWIASLKNTLLPHIKILQSQLYMHLWT